MPDWLIRRRSPTRACGCGRRRSTPTSAAAGCAPSPTRPSRAAAAIAPATSRRSPSARRAGRKAADVARGAIAWGEPVLASAITTVRDGRLYYRGQDAVRAAPRPRRWRRSRGCCAAGSACRRTSRSGRPAGADRRRRAPSPPSPPRADADPPAQGRSADELASEAARLLDLMAAAVAGPEGAGAARGGRRADPRAPRPRLAGAARAAGTRSAARWCCWPTTSSTPRPSPRASPPRPAPRSRAAVLAGLAALSGPRHGGMAARVEAFAGGGGARRLAQGAARRRAAARLRPRALSRRRPARRGAAGRDRDRRRRSRALRARGRGRHRPARQRRLRPRGAAPVAGLPAEAPFALFALARTAGWLAHAIEQINTGALIRPRARYVGAYPSTRRGWGPGRASRGRRAALGDVGRRLEVGVLAALAVTVEVGGDDRLQRRGATPSVGEARRAGAQPRCRPSAAPPGRWSAAAAAASAAVRAGRPARRPPRRSGRRAPSGTAAACAGGRSRPAVISISSRKRVDRSGRRARRSRRRRPDRPAPRATARATSATNTGCKRVSPPPISGITGLIDRQLRRSV